MSIELLIVLIFSAAGYMYSMEGTQVARTIELNDGTHMPVLGLGTWKVASTVTLYTISALYC